MLTDPLAPVEGPTDNPAEPAEPVESKVPAPPPIPISPVSPQPQTQPQPTNNTPANSSGNDKFDFINNVPVGKAAKKARAASSNSFIKRLIVVAGGGVFLILAAVVFFSFLGSSSRANAETLLGIAQRQQEIGRVADLGLSQAQNLTTKNFSITAKFSTQTSQQALMPFIISKLGKNASKDLGGKKDSTVATLLATATQNNDYDNVFLQILYRDLDDYQSSLLSAYKSSTSKTEKKVLQNSYDQVTLIIKNKIST